MSPCQASRKKWKTSLKIDENNEPELLGEILVEEGVEDGVGDGARHSDHVGDRVHHDTQLCTKNISRYLLNTHDQGAYIGQYNWNILGGNNTLVFRLSLSPGP